MVEKTTIRRDFRNLIHELKNKEAYFLVLAGQDIGRVFPVGKDKISFGRDKNCTVPIEDDQVSRKHTEAKRETGGVFLYDLKSTNGTLVNGRRIHRRRLKNNDRIQIGGFTVFKFILQDEMESHFSEDLYNLANRDHLTQIYNKKHYLDRLYTDFSFARRHKDFLTVILLDIDNFKRINDFYGHMAGDSLLLELCRRLTEQLRKEDILARFGGEEFVLLLRSTDMENAIVVAEKMRQRIESSPFPIGDHKEEITISLGIASFTGDNFKNADEMLLKADHRLYRAKRAGRNRICFE